MLLEKYSTSFGHSIEISDEEVSICGLKTPLSAIKDVVLFPINPNLRGLGGCIKFVTDDSPDMPVMNEQIGWEVNFQGETNKGFDIARAKCFWYGGDYSPNGWIEQNAKAKEIVDMVKAKLQ